MAITFSNNFLDFLLVLVALNCFINISFGGRQIDPKSGVQFIKTSCSSTAYPDLCCQTLLGQASTIQTSPQLIAHAALNVTLLDVKTTTESMVQLSQTQPLPPKVGHAMQVSLKELSDTVEALRKSVSEMDKIKSSNVGQMVHDIRSWVSSALTDGFEGDNVSSDSIRSHILTIAHLTSIALALVEDYSKQV